MSAVYDKFWPAVLVSMVVQLTSMRIAGQSIYEPYAFTTFAGQAFNAPARDGVGTAARFTAFRSLGVDGSGTIYAIDSSGLRQVTPGGVVTTLWPGDFYNVRVTSRGEVYVSTKDGTIRRFPDGLTFHPGPVIRFDGPDNLYVLSGDDVLKGPLSGPLTKVASAAEIHSIPAFQKVLTFAVDDVGNIYAANLFSGAIYKADSAGVMRPFVGVEMEPGYTDGVGADARLAQTTSLVTDGSGNLYCINWGYYQRVRKITPDGVVTTVPGWDKFLAPVSPICFGCGYTGGAVLAVDPEEEIIYLGAENRTLVRGTPSNGPTVLAGGKPGGRGYVDGVGEEARFGGDVYVGQYDVPTGIDAVGLDIAGNAYVTDPANYAIRRISTEGEVTTIARSVPRTTPGAPSGLVVDSKTNIFITDTTMVMQVMREGGFATVAGKPLETGKIDGPGEIARFGRQDAPFKIGLTTMARDNVDNLYVYDSGNYAIRKIARTGTNWIVSTLKSFVDVNRKAVQLGSISALAGDNQGNLYAASGFSVVKLAPDGDNWIVSTLAGSFTETGLNDGPGAMARFGSGYSGPSGIAVDGTDNVFVSDTPHSMIRKIRPDGYVTTIGGVPSGGSSDGVGVLASFSSPRGIAVDSEGNVYVADSWNFTFRKGFAVPQIEASPAPTYEDGSFRFTSTAPASHNVTVEYSSNLRDWSQLSTNVPSGGSISISDNRVRDFSRLFYRLVVR